MNNYTPSASHKLRLTLPYNPWIDGQVERMNRTHKEATVKKFHYETHDKLKEHLQRFFNAFISMEKD